MALYIRLNKSPYIDKKVSLYRVAIEIFREDIHPTQQSKFFENLSRFKQKPFYKETITLHLLSAYATLDEET